MRLFLSYSHEQRPIAERLAVRLEEERHHVFFDRTDLGSGEPFDARIRSEIGRASLFIFLVSPQSVKQGSYALTELGLARKRWRRAAGRILPVLVEPVPKELMPEFGVGYFTPEGDWVAGVVARVAEIARVRRLRLIRTISTAAVLAVSGWVAADRWRPHPKPPCRLAAEFQPSPARSVSMPEGLTLHVVAGGVTHDFLVQRDGTCRFEVEASQVGDWSVDFTSADGLAWGRSSLHGCPTAPTRVTLDEGSSLTILPQ
jgi:hypothetical protein